VLSDDNRLVYTDERQDTPDDPDDSNNNNNEDPGVSSQTDKVGGFLDCRPRFYHYSRDVDALKHLHIGRRARIILSMKFLPILCICLVFYTAMFSVLRHTRRSCTSVPVRIYTPINLCYE